MNPEFLAEARRMVFWVFSFADVRKTIGGAGWKVKIKCSVLNT